MRATSRSTIEALIPAAAAARLATLVLAGCLAALPALAGTNRIVLRVNDHIATLQDYEMARRQLIEALQRSELPPERLQQRLADVGVEVMSDLFEELLLLSRAKQIGAEPTREEVNAAVARAREVAGIQDEGEFVQALASSGFTLETFREHMKKNLTMQGVMGREIRPRIRLNEEDLRRYYQVHLEDYRVPTRLEVREIVVLDSATTSDEGRASIAQDIRERLIAGEPPEEAIASYVEKGLVTSWIDLGWVTQGDLDPSLEDAIWDLDAGEYSAAVPARGGLHICQVVERQEATIQEFSAVADQIREQETNRRFQTEIGEYLAELERNSYVIVKPPPEAAGFRTVVALRREQGLERDERQDALAAALSAAAPPPAEPAEEPPAAEPSDDPEEPPR